MIKSDDVKNAIENFKVRADEINANPDLTPVGRQRKQQALMAEIEAYKPAARQALSAEWKWARTRAADLEKRRIEAQEANASRWDFQRLNYEATAAIQAIRNAHDVAEVKRLYNQALASRDDTKARAWAELGAGAVQERFSDMDGKHLAERMAADLGELLTTEAITKVEEAAALFGPDLHELVKTTREVSGLYHPGDLDHNAKNDFSELLEGVSVSQRMDAQNLAIVYDVELLLG